MMALPDMACPAMLGQLQLAWKLRAFATVKLHATKCGDDETLQMLSTVQCTMWE